MADMTASLPTARPRRLIAGLWPLLLCMALMLVLGMASVLVVSWTRSYALGHAIWGIAEHRAAFELDSYARSGDPAAWERFRRELAVPLADRVARLQLQQEKPDLELVRRSFLDGRIPPEDISGLIHLFRIFQHLPLMNHAVQTWEQADALVLELQHTGLQMHEEYGRAAPDRARLQQLALHARGVHERIAPLLREFGATVGKASRQFVAVLLVVLPLFAITLVVVGVALFRALDQRARQAAEALHDLTARLEHQATHDPLTGLANRRRFEALLNAVVAPPPPAAPRSGSALLYFDLDQFKVVNDTCGHAAGDELIKQVGWRVRQQLGSGSTLARLGGDEFGVLVPDCDAAAAVSLGEKLRQSIDDLRFYWNERVFAVSASIGVLVLDDAVHSVAEALSAADQACYLAKDNGRNRVQLYRPDDSQMRQRSGEMQWVERIRMALDTDGFTLVAQEIRPLAMRAGPRTGQHAEPARRFELLLRMTGPDGRMVGPMAFIPAAERYGLMPRIDRWVIARACSELGALRRRGVVLPTCMINISGASASDPGLADHLADCLRHHGLDGAHVGIELTETVAVGNIEACSQLMRRLRGMGCPIALDDFGTGMSSFSYLRNLPIDLIKIDRAFIRGIARDPLDHALVETIQHIAGIMGIRTVAEGVEDAEVLTALALIGVDFAQGWHVGRPVPLVQIHPESGDLHEPVVRRVALRAAAP